MINGNELVLECGNCGASVTFYTGEEGMTIDEGVTLLSFVSSHLRCTGEEEEE